MFKDIKTRKMIGCGIRWGKLYYLDLESKSIGGLQQALIVGDSREDKKKAKIWLWHHWLGHASFGYLRKLFPSLFAKVDVFSF